MTPLHDARPLLTDPEALRALAWRDGYLYLPRSAPLPVVQALRLHVARACADQGLVADPDAPLPQAPPGARLLGLGYDDPRYVAVQQAILPGGALQVLRETPAVRDVLAAVFEAEVQPQGGDVCRIVLPEAPERTTRPHQDAFYVAPPVWTAWWPLHDCPLDLGPLAVWPGSHAAGLRPHLGQGGHLGIAGLDGVAWAASALQAGDVVLFSSLTVHRALPNRTPAGVRLSVDCRFGPAPGASAP